MPEVRLVKLTKKYGQIIAANNVDLHIRDKEYVSILGPSGCGKTTLIKCIAGIIRPEEGEVYIGGKLVNEAPIQERGVGYVFQEIALFPHKNVYENVSYGPTVKGWNVTETRNLVGEMLDMMKLRDRAGAYAEELSGGARQKTAVARALASGSLLLLLDEPLGALDVKVRAVLRYELRRLVKDLGLTAIHVTHDQEEAMAISDRVVVMKAGRIVEVGTPMELYLRPKKIFTANFVGEANFLEGRVLDVTPEDSVLEVNGRRLLTVSRARSKGEKVVVAVRPEFISMKEYRGHQPDRWEGRIEREVFAGSTIRYEVQIGNGRLLAVKYPVASGGPEFKVGDRVSLILPPKNVIVYAYPRGGLEKEISLE